MIIAIKIRGKHSIHPIRPQPTIPLLQTIKHLEHHLMGELSLRETPASLKVFRKVLCLFDGSENSVVNRFLVGSFGFRNRLLSLGLAILEELLLSGGGSLGRRFGEVGIVEFLIDLSGNQLKERSNVTFLVP